MRLFQPVRLLETVEYSQVCNNRNTTIFLEPHYKSLYLVKKVLIVGQVLKKKVPTYVYCSLADLRVGTQGILTYVSKVKIFQECQRHWPNHPNQSLSVACQGN